MRVLRLGFLLMMMRVFGIEMRVSFKVMGTSRTITYCCNNCHVCLPLMGFFFLCFGFCTWMEFFFHFFFLLSFPFFFFLNFLFGTKNGVLELGVFG